MNKAIPLLLASALIFPLSSFAAEGSAPGDHCERRGDMFTKADTDNDGTIDRKEAEAMHNKHFDEMDTNHDGKLSKEEIAACKKNKVRDAASHEKGSAGFMRADKDHDGTLTREEAKVLPRISKNFDKIDADKDGTLDRDEVHNFMSSIGK